MKTFVFVILLSSLLYAQYSQGDSNLVLTTYTRQFNKTVIRSYLNSNNPRKVNAALLSISQSEDTLFINDIIRLSFLNMPGQIAFALGQLGASNKSDEYLQQIIFNFNLTPSIREYALKSIGKVCSRQTSLKIINTYLNNMQTEFPGISIALYNIYQRKLIDKKEILPVIENELNLSAAESGRVFEAAFLLYRAGGPHELKDLILKKIKEGCSLQTNNYNHFEQYSMPYLLGCLRQIKFFPDDNILFNKILTVTNFAAKVEAVKALSYLMYSSKENLNKYLNLLNDKNQNIVRQVAVSLSGLNADTTLYPYIKNTIDSILIYSKASALIKGELLLSYINLFNDNFAAILNAFQKSVPPSYIFKAASKFISSTEAFNFLTDNYHNAVYNNKIIILEALTGYQKKIQEDKKLKRIFFDALSSNSPALISIAADGIDSFYIAKNIIQLKNILLQTTKHNKNNPDFLESLLSIYNLAGRIDKNFIDDVAKILNTSNLYSVKKIADRNNKVLPHKTDNHFYSTWNNAFKYNKAEITTSKGNFTIKLLPEFAPISAGNFCYLSKNNFFNNIKFHRVVPGFVIQTGDPTGTGWGGPGYDIVSEFSPHPYLTGVVGMASAGKDTEGSQWFVTTGNYPHLNERYTVFAVVVKGLETVFKITQEDKIISIKLIND